MNNWRVMCEFINERTAVPETVTKIIWRDQLTQEVAVNMAASHNRFPHKRPRHPLAVRQTPELGLFVNDTFYAEPMP